MACWEKKGGGGWNQTYVCNEVDIRKQTAQWCPDNSPGHWAPALFVLSTWQTARDPAPPSPALSRQLRALCLPRHYGNRKSGVSVQPYRNSIFTADHFEIETDLIVKRTSRSTVPWRSCSCVTTPVKTRCLIWEDTQELCSESQSWVNQN